NADVSHDQTLIRGEDLGWPRKALHLEGAGHEVAVRQPHGMWIPYGLLVTWQRIQSPRPASARTTAGRSLARDRSENGKGTRTTAAAAGGTTQYPPRACPSPCQASARSGWRNRGSQSRECRPGS